MKIEINDSIELEVCETCDFVPAFCGCDIEQCIGKALERKELETPEHMYYAIGGYHCPKCNATVNWDDKGCWKCGKALTN